MGRTAQGWTFGLDPRTGHKTVRFRHAGRRHNLSTRTSDPVEAAVEAGRIYSAVVSGKPLVARRRTTTTGLSFRELVAEWVAQLTVDEQTADTYELYAFTHWADRWTRIEQVDAGAVALYTDARLKRVTRSTVKKELSALRGFLKWCHKAGHLEELPPVPPPAKEEKGVRHKYGTRKIIELTEAEVRKILAHLPVKSPRYGTTPRAFFTVMYETSLRRETMFSLTMPHDYEKGRKHLTIRDEADKARFGRDVPLSAIARKALDGVIGKRTKGEIFKRADFRAVLRRAATDAGLEEHRVERLSYHDFRHSRVTNLLETSTNLMGVGFLAGHKHATTTNKYAKQSQRAAASVLSESSGTRAGHGTRGRSPAKPRKKTKRSR